MALIGIVAVDRNGAIGKGGGLPWHYSSDMRFFREQTTNHACVMGRRTWLSLGKPLKNRLNIILSRTFEVEPQPSVIVLRDALSVLSLRDYLARDMFILGGAQVFGELLPHIDRWMVTEVPLIIEDADTFMPHDFLAGFRATGTRQLEDDLRVVFYERSIDKDGQERPDRRY